jgi:hypothetical protein
MKLLFLITVVSATTAVQRVPTGTAKSTDQRRTKIPAQFISSMIVFGRSLTSAQFWKNAYDFVDGNSLLCARAGVGIADLVVEAAPVLIFVPLLSGQGFRVGGVQAGQFASSSYQPQPQLQTTLTPPASIQSRCSCLA